jgi:hypothetical protein
MPPLYELPFQGSLAHMARRPRLSELAALLQDALSAVDAVAQAQPGVRNLPKLAARIRRDLAFLRQQLADVSTGDADERIPEARLQGIVNDLRGFWGELLALQEAPGVVAVCKRFCSEPPRLWAPRCSAEQAPHLACTSATHADRAVAAAIAAAAGGGRRAWLANTEDSSSSEATASERDSCGGSSPTSSSCNEEPMVRSRSTRTERRRGSGAGDNAQLLVEVDVVCHDGQMWVEVKNQALFGLESVVRCAAGHAMTRVARHDSSSLLPHSVPCSIVLRCICTQIACSTGVAAATARALLSRQPICLQSRQRQ